MDEIKLMYGAWRRRMASEYHFDESLVGPARQVNNRVNHRIYVIPRRLREVLGQPNSSLAYSIREAAILLIGQNDVDGKDGVSIAEIHEYVCKFGLHKGTTKGTIEYVWRNLYWLCECKVLVCKREMRNDRLTNVYYLHE